MTKTGWVTVSTLLLGVLSWPSFALQLLDGKNFLYDIGKNSALSQGTLDAYAGMYHLRVNGANYVGQMTDLTADGREAHREVFVEPNSGLEIKRQVYVSKTQNFARFSEILSNPNETAVLAEVEVFGKLGSGNQTVAVVEQSNFLITDDVINEVSGSIPVLLHYHSQVNHPVQAIHTLSGNQLRWVYNLTVPAQTQIRLIYFVAQTTDIATAQQVATFIYGNPTALYEGLTAAAQKQLFNFKPPKPIPRDDNDRDFSQAPFLNLDELRTGQLEESDPWSRQRTATPADAYALNLDADTTVTIRMSAAFNAYLYLFQDVKGEVLVAANDDGRVNTTHAELVVTAEQTGTYYIEATAHNRWERGDYTLEIFTGASNQIPNAYAFEWTQDPLTAPATVTLTDFSTDLDGKIVERCWQFGDGTPLTCDPSETIIHTYEMAGQYRVGLIVRDDEEAYAYSNGSVSVSWASPGPGVVLPVSNTVPGELASSDARSQTRSSAFADHYRITSVAVGQELVIDMTSDQFDSYLYLYDQYYRLLHQDDNSGGDQHARLRYTPMRSGDLLIEATSVKDNTLGKYNLTLGFADQNPVTTVPIDVAPTFGNPLQNLLIARVPESFQATNFHWDFGDNSPEVRTDKAIVSHTYPQAGDFTVTVTILNRQNQQLPGKQTVNISHQTIVPEVRFRATPLFGQKPLRVFFNNESTLAVFDNLSEPLRYVWQFGDSEVSTDVHPAHTFLQGGTYHVTLKAFSHLTQQSASYSMPITVIDRHSAEIPITGTVRERPQVLMGGFDPMLVDLKDTDIKIFALVRPGKTALQTVRFLQNGSDFQLVMQHVATYANGDQRYETVLTFPQGIFPVLTFGNLWGEQLGQFRIQAIDQAGQFHAFPNLEIGNNPPVAVIQRSLNIEPLHQVGVRRRQPQVLAAGFDPALVHLSNTTPTLTSANDAQFMVKAIVREGLFPIQSVTLKQNQGDFHLPMRWQETLSNGDKLYVVNYTYPSGRLENGTWGSLFGNQATQFMVVVVDKAAQVHRFPEVKIGNFLQQ